MSQSNLDSLTKATKAYISVSRKPAKPFWKDKDLYPDQNKRGKWFDLGSIPNLQLFSSKDHAFEFDKDIYLVEFKIMPPEAGLFSATYCRLVKKVKPCKLCLDFEQFILDVLKSPKNPIAPLPEEIKSLSKYSKFNYTTYNWRSNYEVSSDFHNIGRIYSNCHPDNDAFSILKKARASGWKKYANKYKHVCKSTLIWSWAVIVNLYYYDRDYPGAKKAFVVSTNLLAVAQLRITFEAICNGWHRLSSIDLLPVEDNLQNYQLPNPNDKNGTSPT
jgi:hypothetical protein